MNDEIHHIFNKKIQYKKEPYKSSAVPVRESVGFLTKLN